MFAARCDPLLFTTQPSPCPFFFFFNDTATTEIYTLSLHDALPISAASWSAAIRSARRATPRPCSSYRRSEEHTSELQSHSNIVCRLLLEKKKWTRLGKRQRVRRVWRRPRPLSSADKAMHTRDSAMA